MNRVRFTSLKLTKSVVKDKLALIFYEECQRVKCVNYSFDTTYPMVVCTRSNFLQI